MKAQNQYNTSDFEKVMIGESSSVYVSDENEDPRRYVYLSGEELFFGFVNESSKPDGFGVTVNSEFEIFVGNFANGIRQGLGKVYNPIQKRLTKSEWHEGKIASDIYDYFGECKIITTESHAPYQETPRTLAHEALTVSMETLMDIKRCPDGSHPIDDDEGIFFTEYFDEPEIKKLRTVNLELRRQLDLANAYIQAMKNKTITTK